MAAWTSDDLDTIGAATQVGLTSLRNDGTPRPYVTTWIVRVGQDLYVRSVRGQEGRWFQHAMRRHEGRIRADGLDRDIRFEEPEETVNAAVNQAYRTKYAQYSEEYVGPLVASGAASTTLRLVPRG